MATLTIVVPEDVLKRARLRAVEQGTSVNAILRDRLEAFAGDPRLPRDLVVSAQVLGEFYVTVTRRLARPLIAPVATQAVDQLASFEVAPIDRALVHAAIRTSQYAQISYWDALIVDTAAGAGCNRVLTEDLAGGSIIGNVAIVNLFATN